MYQALYRKWRPQTFEDVYGQEHITSILKSEVENEKISHAYLFCGPRGTGKTTCAKIIAKAVNCEDPKNGNPCGVCAACRAIDAGLTTDVVEMDAASNNGVDNIRELRDGVVYTPAELKYRVYIIDEVHMLSISAFNALLKTLEEPPKYVIFILATTELHKIPATVLSRCQRFDFRRVAPAALIDRMKTVCAGEGIDADDGALSLIARLSQGSFRDALNMLEFCSGESKTITAESAGRLLGSSSMQTLSELSAAIAGGDVARALDTVNEIYLSSRDITVFWRELISFLRDVLIAIVTKGSVCESDACREAAELFAPARLVEIIETFTSAEADMARTPSSAKLYAELAIIKTTATVARVDDASLAERVSAVESEIKKLQSGGFAKVNNIYPSETSKKPAPAPVLTETVPRDDKKAEEEKKPSQSGRIVFKSVKNWADIVRMIAQTDASIAPNLFRARALEGSDGRLYIFFDNSFAVSIIGSSPNTKKNLSKAVLAVTGKEFLESDIISLVEKNAEAVIHEPIDYILEKIKESEGETT